MILKVAAAVLLTAVVAALGEVIIRRNRRSRALGDHLAAHGSAVLGIVRAVDKVSTGKYGAHKLRATVGYSVGSDPYTHVAVWAPEHAPRLVPGDSIELLVDPAQPSSVCVAGTLASAVERDAPYRWFAVGVGVAAFVLLLVS